jgi:hypothetical protein
MVDATNSLDARNLNFVPYPDFLFAFADLSADAGRICKRRMTERKSAGLEIKERLWG